jgi:hypothetical protein
VVVWPGDYVSLCCPGALLIGNTEACPWCGTPAFRAIRPHRGPDIHVSVMRDHDLGDCDESYRRML